jgi:archaellum component FlaC
MTDDDAPTDLDEPTDLDVRLEWPEVETPAVTKRPLREAPPPSKKKRRREQALVPLRRGSGGSAEDMFAQLDALTRVVSKLSTSDIDQLSDRVEQLAAAVGEKGTGAQLKRTSADVRSLANRVDSLARAVEALPSGSTLADLVGRVDTLAGTVETFCEQAGPGADRLDFLKGHVTKTLEPLHEATDQVRRLTDTVSKSMASRSDRQAELHAQIQTLADEVRELRRTFPVGKTGPGVNVVEAVTAAVKAALVPEPAKKAPAKKAQAKKAQAKKAPAKKASAGRATARKRSGRAASAQT